MYCIRHWTVSALLAGLIGLGCVASPIYAAEDMTQRGALASQLYARMQALTPENTTERLIEQSLKAFKDQPCFYLIKPRLDAMVKKYSQQTIARQQTISAYAKYFSTDELQQLIDFSFTPVGAKWFKTQPVIAADAANLAMTHFQQNQLAIARETMEIIDSLSNSNCRAGSR